MELSNSNIDFLISARNVLGDFIETNSVVELLKKRASETNVLVQRMPFDEMKQWVFDPKTNFLIHNSGKFFSIEGLSVNTNYGDISQWDQPIINQPEIGYLGIICKKINGTLHFLLQIKVEPGNINYCQLSPTLQATRSNYSKVHQGKSPKYLEYFANVKKDNILLNQLQSEQGARFLRKRNRNIIIRVEEEIELDEDFIWLTLGQIKNLLLLDNIVNMDTRTVISGIPFGSLCLNDCLNYLSDSNIDIDPEKNLFLKSMLIEDCSVNSLGDILSFLTDLKSQYDLFLVSKRLDNLSYWLIESDQIRHFNNNFFRVIGVNVAIDGREVASWDQPMIQPMNPGICGFIVKKINGILHFIVQAKLECGNQDIFELAPTVQCLTGGYLEINGEPVCDIPFLSDLLAASKGSVIYDSMQSEEGGRFYREQNRNIIALVGDEFSIDLPERYIWMTLNQLMIFMKFNNYLNVQARNLISLIGLHED